MATGSGQVKSQQTELKHLVTMSINRIGTAPTQMAIEAVRTNPWIGRAAEEWLDMASAAKRLDDPIEQVATNALIFEGWE